MHASHTAIEKLHHYYYRHQLELMMMVLMMSVVLVVVAVGIVFLGEVVLAQRLLLGRLLDISGTVGLVDKLRVLGDFAGEWRSVLGGLLLDVGKMLGIVHVLGVVRVSMSMVLGMAMRVLLLEVLTDAGTIWTGKDAVWDVVSKVGKEPCKDSKGDDVEAPDAQQPLYNPKKTNAASKNVAIQLADPANPRAQQDNTNKLEGKGRAQVGSKRLSKKVVHPAAWLTDMRSRPRDNHGSQHDGNKVDKVGTALLALNALLSCGSCCIGRSGWLLLLDDALPNRIRRL